MIIFLNSLFTITTLVSFSSLNIIGVYIAYFIINEIRKNGVAPFALYLPKSILELEIKSIHDFLRKKDDNDDEILTGSDSITVRRSSLVKISDGEVVTMKRSI